VHLTAEQREIAAELFERARPLMDRGMSIGEALDAAAIQAGHLPQLVAAEANPEPED
jgi:uncharacterized protein YoaH (UPF0181 family)